MLLGAGDELVALLRRNDGLKLRNRIRPFRREGEAFDFLLVNDVEGRHARNQRNGEKHSNRANLVAGKVANSRDAKIGACAARKLCQPSLFRGAVMLH